MRRLLLFAKRPRLGHVKTRLAVTVGEREALALYRAFLADQIAFVQSLREVAECELWLDGTWRTTADIPLRQQGAGDLGERLLRAFRRCLREGAAASVAIGADSPTLPRAIVLAAFDALEAGADAVAAPAADGGYVAIGVRRPDRALFGGVAWGGPDVLRRTAENARRAGTELRLVAPWYDVDDIEDLRRLARDLAHDAALRAPASRRAIAALDPAALGGPDWTRRRDA